MASAVNDLLRCRPQRGHLPGVPRGIFPIVINTTFGVKSVEPRLFEAAAMLGCQGASMFRQVVLPAAMPSIFNGLRLGHGIAWF